LVAGSRCSFSFALAVRYAVINKMKNGLSPVSAYPE
jgi:hypothetical protein